MKQIKNKTTIKNKGKTFQAVVVSNKMDNTLVVAMDIRKPHPKYKKIQKHTKKLYVDDNLKAKVGDKVLIRETRPISKLKRFITVKII